MALPHVPFISDDVLGDVPAGVIHVGLGARVGSLLGSVIGRPDAQISSTGASRGGILHINMHTFLSRITFLAFLPSESPLSAV